MRVCTIGCFGFLLAVLAGGCNKDQAQAPPPKPPVVLVSYPAVQEVIDYEEVTGRTDAKPSVEIRPRVSGYLVKVPFQEGAVVKKNTLLYKINPEPYQADLDKAEANLEQGKAKVQQFEADFRRAEFLTQGKGAIAKAEYDRTRADLYDARAALKSYQAMLKKAKINVEYTTIEAPFDGRVSRSLLDEGNLVKADETLLTTIIALDPMYTFFDVDERTWLRLLKLIREKKIKSLDEGNLPVKMGLADEEGFPHDGWIDFADNKLDPGTGTMRMRAKFPNPYGTLLTPGMFVRLRVDVGTSYPAVLIAERAFERDQGQKFLWVIKERTNDKQELESYVEYRKVKTGSLHDGARVVEDGLKFILRPRSFATLRTDPVPEEVLAKLGPLQDKSFEKLSDFSKALAQTLSPAQVTRYRAQIAQAALENGPTLTLRMRSFRALRTERVPDEVLEKLGRLQDKSFDKLSDFLQALTDTLAPEQVKRYRTQIAQAALERVVVNGLQRARRDARVEPKTMWEQAAEGADK
jgi:RND family efflux transporter MFP subunit